MTEPQLRKCEHQPICHKMPSYYAICGVKDCVYDTRNNVAGEAQKVLEVLDNFFGRLENAVTEAEGISVVTWADIDCLYGEFKDELRQREEQG
jgi:hypothetical protein